MLNNNNLVDIIKRWDLKKGDLVLDIGSNDGSFLELAKKKQFKVLGVEPTNTAKISVQRRGVLRASQI